jgi:hypothetical protein
MSGGDKERLNRKYDCSESRKFMKRTEFERKVYNESGEDFSDDDDSAVEL